MATVTKTFTEGDSGSSYRSSWTATLVGNDITANDSTFEFITPTLSAKYVYSGKNQANYYFGAGFTIGTKQLVDGNSKPLCFVWTKGTFDNQVAMTSGTTYVIPKTTTPNADWRGAGIDYVPTTGSAHTLTLTTSDFFNVANKTERTLDVVITTCDPYNFSSVCTGATSSKSWNQFNEYYSNSLFKNSKVATLTLDVPPSVTVGTPTFPIPFAGLSAYSVPMTTLAAYYGGDITSAVLTIGAESTTQTYSSATVTNKTIAVTPTIPGTYTPTLVVADSRGQTTTITFTSITVGQYTAPSLNFDVFRTNSSGVKDDEGAYGLITATINFTDAIAAITQPAVTIDGVTTNNVTWYSAYNSSTGVSSAISDWTTFSSGDTIYGLINGSFSGSQSYVIGVTETDSQGGVSPTIAQTLSTAFYTIDFQAGGKEIAFGAPANDNLASYPDGLFKCQMDAQFNGDIAAVGDNTFATGDTEIENPYFSLDTTAAPGTTDGDLYAAIVALGWDSDVIV